ncbi:chitin-binding protein [Allocatelliglobosispora scoriae]|uniref:Chitin-binding protein n=1 Tax=Allocatelliglobosispora scoriae TaxID=643052 RepID=A0A841C6T5_9ACTN|nr:lytic polysaccharide monooxygenase [Allocatelliglobosispora scoriae]MBB5874491.1 chitin-binding protein [Allocatelliglobosispora scoriae]
MPTSNARRLRIALYAMIMAVVAASTLTTVLADVADAHGNIVAPASRNYGCWQRWGSDFQNPAMATQDPMCWQAWQTETNAMWNWNGLFREGVAGNHQGAIPDGQLCSAGLTQGGRYRAMDTVGDWKAQSIGNSFSVKLFDQASHGADYIAVYVTKQGYNPLTQPLGWGNLELLGHVGNTPASQWTPETGGVSIQVPTTAPGRTGRHIVYTIWQASHLDQSYYFCSDVNFGGPTPSVSPSASRSPSPSVSPSRSTSPSPSVSPSRSTPPPTPSVSPVPGGCAATYSLVGQWPGGFQGEIKVTAGSAAITKWTVTASWTNGQKITSGWGALVTVSGTVATAKNETYNGALAAGASTTFGFLGSATTSTNGAPTLTCAPV